MGNDTTIQWTNSSWNPIRGCSRVDDDCINCYAEGVAARFSGPGLAYEGLARRSSNGLPLWTGKVRMVPEHLADPLRWQRPRKVFVNSMSDIFHEELTNEQIAAIFGVMAAAPRHTFQVLTKRAKRMKEWFDWVQQHDEGDAWTNCHWEALRFETENDPDGDGGPVHRKSMGAPGRPWPLPNVHLGVSCGFQRVADERIPYLLQCPAVVRWVSAEPLLGPVDLSVYLVDDLHRAGRAPRREIDWVVVGGESGPRARRFDLNWGRAIVSACKAAGAQVFVKQLGAHPREEMADIRGGYGDRPLDLAGEVVDLIRSRPGPDWTRVVEPDRAAWIRYLHLKDSHGGDPAEWPEDLRVRQFPVPALASSRPGPVR